LIGIDLLKSQLVQGGFCAKKFCNQQVAIFLPVDQQHRERKTDGISYEDDYAGDGLAATLSPGRVEIRFQRDFNEARLATIMRTVLADPALSPMRDWQVLYQGREIDQSE